jgi:hypothetical protein
MTLDYNYVSPKFPIRNIEPKDVNGCVLSLIAKQANAGSIPVTASSTVFSDQSPVKNTFSYTNGITNPNMVTTTDWGATTGNLTASNNELSVTNYTAATASICSSIMSPGTIIGNIYYGVGLLKTLSNQVAVRVGTTAKYHSGSGEYEKLSVLHTATTTSHSFNPYDSRASGTYTIKLKQVLVVNLTALGLAHLTLAQCDALFSFVVTSGTTSISTIGNDCSMINQAKTSISGFTSDYRNNITDYYNRFDGIDDYGWIPNKPSIDITIEEFAICSTFRIRSDSAATFLICKTSSLVTEAQYAMGYNSITKTIDLLLNGSIVCSTPANGIVEEKWYNVIFYRNTSGVITPYLNKVVGTPTTYSTALTSQPNLRVGARTTNAGGTTHSGYFKGDIATLTMYSLPSSLIIKNIIDAEMNIAEEYMLMAAITWSDAGVWNDASIWDDSIKMVESISVALLP